MSAFYTPGMPYDLNTFLDNLGAYSVSEASFETLETARQITESGQYYFLGVPFPGRGNTVIAGRDTFTGNITVPPLSYLICLTGDTFYNTDVNGENPKGTRAKEGFQLRIYDKGGKIDTFLTTTFGNNNPSVGLMANYANPNSPNNNPVGPFFPPSPMVILNPGSLQLSITNLATTDCYIQVLLQLAVPINRQSANEMIIQGNVRR